VSYGILLLLAIVYAQDMALNGIVPEGFSDADMALEAAAPSVYDEYETSLLSSNKMTTVSEVNRTTRGPLTTPQQDSLTRTVNGKSWTIHGLHSFMNDQAKDAHNEKQMAQQATDSEKQSKENYSKKEKQHKADCKRKKKKMKKAKKKAKKKVKKAKKKAKKAKKKAKKKNEEGEEEGQEEIQGESERQGEVERQGKGTQGAESEERKNKQTQGQGENQKGAPKG